MQIKKKPIHVVEPHTSQSHLVDRFDEKWDAQEQQRENWKQCPRLEKR